MLPWPGEGAVRTGMDLATTCCDEPGPMILHVVSGGNTVTGVEPQKNRLGTYRDPLSGRGWLCGPLPWQAMPEAREKEEN